MIIVLEIIIYLYSIHESGGLSVQKYPRERRLALLFPQQSFNHDQLRC